MHVSFIILHKWQVGIFKKVRYASNINNKGNMLVNLGQFEDENPLDIMQSFLGCENAQGNSKRPVHSTTACSSKCLG